jgi:tetratricopeptide (TPR) repeat protein
VPWLRLLFYSLWIAASVAPVLSPFTSTAFLIQDRYLYCATPAFGLLLGELLAGTGQRLRQPVLPWVALPLLAACLGLCLSRGMDWRSAEGLFADAARKQPNSAFGHSYLASYLFHASASQTDPGKKDEMLRRSLQEHERAWACDDFDRLLAPYWIMNEHASLLHSRGDQDRARELFRRVWEGRPELLTEQGAKAMAVGYLATDALSTRHDLREGLRLLEEGLKLSPDHPGLLANRLRAWYELGETEKVRREAERLRDHPVVGPVAREMLGALPPAPPREVPAP